MSFLYIYFGCLVCSVLFLKQRFPVAPIKSDLCFIEHTVVYMLALVLPSTSVSIFSVTLGKHSTNTVWEARGNTFKAVLVSHLPLPHKWRSCLGRKGCLHATAEGQALGIPSAAVFHRPNNESLCLFDQPISNASCGQVYQVLSTGC